MDPTPLCGVADLRASPVSLVASSNVMGYAKVRSIALLGMAGQVVVVEADVAIGLPMLVVSGLPDAALTESRDRVRAAVVNSGETWPQRRITASQWKDPPPHRC
jgi:hypothetical protein